MPLPLHVLLLFATSAIGGAERSLTRMALNSRNGSVRYTLATLGEEGDWTQWAGSQGADAVALAGSPAAPRNKVRALMDLWQRIKPDFIYVMGLRPTTLVRALRPFMPRTRIVHGIRGNVEPGTPLGRDYRRVEWPQRFLTDHYITNAEVTKRSLARLISVSPLRIDVVYNGIEAPEGPPIAWPARAREIVVVANLAPRKGHIPFLDAIKLVVTELPETRVRFIGRDDMNGAVARAVQEAGLEQHVIMHGYDRNPEKWMAQAQMLVLHSLWGEGCPTSILEALSHGTPVVSYATDGVPELIADGQDGILVPPKDTVEMAAAILRLLRDPETATSYGLAGRAKVLERFTLAATADAHMEIFSRLASR